MVKIGKVQLSYLFPSPIRLHINRFQQSFECIFCLLNTKANKNKSLETKDDGAELASHFLTINLIRRKNIG